MVATVLLCGFPAPAGSSVLPDGRRYELVSPSAKGSGDVISDQGRTRVAISGNAVSFASLRAFGDVLGAGIGTEYVSQRTGAPGTSGWSTHSLEPRRDALSLIATVHGKDLRYEDVTSPDLSGGIVHSFTPLTDAPNVAGVSNLYLRTDVLSGGEGAYQLLTDCLVCTSPLSDPVGRYMPRTAAATPDLGHIIIEAAENLTPETAGLDPVEPKLYEWDHGTLRLAGVLPNGMPAPSSIAGSGALQLRYTVHTISNDGARIFFTVSDSIEGADGVLYMRVDHASTVQINASERTDCASNGPCTGAPAPDPSGAQPAAFQTATPDGSKVFFTSSERLTDAPQGGLYMYDASLPDSDPHNLTLIAAGGRGVVGASDDGNYVYLVAGKLFPGQPDFPPDALLGLYLWHSGTLTLIGSLPLADINSVTLGPDTVWALKPYSARVTPDGKSLIVATDNGSGLTGFDQGSSCGLQGGRGCEEVYLYRAESDTLTCVSCNPNGTPSTTDTTFAIKTGTGGFASAPHINHPITDDGNRVFFETTSRLVAEDRNGAKSDVYEYDVLTGTLHLISTGTSTSDSHFLETGRNGDDVFFTTNQRLVGWDTDENYDLYDARVGGGFPEPPAVKPECSGDACRGALPAVPGATSAASSGAVPGSNNVLRHGGHRHRKRHCARGRVRRRVHGHVRCVRRHRHARRALRGSAR